MNHKHNRLLLTALTVLIFALAFGSIASAQTDIGDDDDTTEEEGEVGASCPLNDPTVGMAAPARARVQHGTTAMITREVPLRWKSDFNAFTGIIIPAGKEFHVSGVDLSGEWVRLTISCSSGWVPRNATTLPPVVFRPSF